MSIQGKKTNELFKKALAVMPYGVNSNFRYWAMMTHLLSIEVKGHMFGMQMENGILITA